MIEKHQEILEKFYKELFDNQKDLPKEYGDIFDDNFWDLY
jgi:hypothetical protein